jgi:hypothetical protein
MKRATTKTILYSVLLASSISFLGSCKKEQKPERCECADSILFHVDNDEDISKLMEIQASFEYNEQTGEYTSQYYTEDDCAKDGQIISQSNAATVYSRCRKTNE